MTPAELLTAVEAATARRIDELTDDTGHVEDRDAMAEAFQAEADVWRGALELPPGTDPDVTALLGRALGIAAFRAETMARRWRDLADSARARAAS